MTARYGILSGETLAEIITELNSVQTPTNQLEFEAKFGYYTRSGFKSNVMFRRFNALKEILSKKLTSKKEHITDHRSKSGIRKQMITSENGEKVLWQRKNTLKDFDIRQLRDYNLRISINAEKTIPPVEDFVYDIVRVKDRESFYYGKNLRVDMSVVTTVDQSHPDKSRTTYEVEVEVLNWDQGNQIGIFSSFSNLLRFLFEGLYDTALPYTVNEKRDLARYVNDTLGEKSGTTLRFGMVAQARNLKFADMVWGGLVGNQIKKKGEMVANYYSVTHKADGLRKFLVINEVGIWLVFPPEEFNLVYRFTRQDHDVSIRGLILDGELIPNDPEHRKAANITLSKRKRIAGLEMTKEADRDKLRLIPHAKYWYLVFDALAIDGNKDIQFQPHFTRMKESYDAMSKLEDVHDNDRLVIHFKAFKQISTPEDFYGVMQRMFDEKESLPYADDGFIFMSEEAPYNPIGKFGRKLRLRERTLPKHEDMCKWKPVERLTIDFSIKKKGDGKVELMAIKGGKELVPFTGTRYNPFDPKEMVEHDHPLIKEYPTGSVIEFEWDFAREKFVPLIPRPDKRKPNSLTIANDDWDDLHNPITQDVLEGKNFTLMRKYHNRIKRRLFTKSLARDKSKPKYLLDIGTGRGGDVSKMNGYDKIVAVEPNEEHIVELERRINVLGMEDKVRIVQCGGEEVKKISKAVDEFIGEKVDTVSLMLSMTFFWKNKKLLRNLVNTITSNIKDDGKIILLVMDGDTVEEVFDPFFLGIKSQKLIFHQTSEGQGYATLELQPQNEVDVGHGREAYVYIKDSIVGITTKGSGDTPSQKAIVTHGEIPVIMPSKKTENVKVSEIPVIFAGDVKSVHENKGHSITAQVEYLVHLTDFEDMLKEKFNVSSELYRADREHFLTDAEKKFSMMFSFGMYTLRDLASKDHEDIIRFGKALKGGCVDFEDSMLYVPLEETMLYLPPDHPQREYYRRRETGDKVITLHWGQRKLLITEIEFLTKFWDPEETSNPVIVYVGAAGGEHIPILEKLFPQISEFHLYDPAKFHISSTDKIHIYNQLFSDDDAEKWKDRDDVFFISDIRTGNYKTMSTEENERAILRDMDFQKNWVEIIKPVKSHLKFRLPYPDFEEVTDIDYFDGVVMFQPWAPITSTETRLVPHSSLDYTNYNSLVYEEQLFYHNTVTRNQQTFCNPFAGSNKASPINPPELLNDYDSVAESIILKEYLEKFDKPSSQRDVSNLSDKITRLLNKQSHSHKTLNSLRKENF